MQSKPSSKNSEKKILKDLCNPHQIRISFSFHLIFRFGNWIFVNFPNDNDTWSILNEKNIRPDDVVVLQDTSAQLDGLQKRWYKANKATVDKEVHEREEREANDKRIHDEEEK